MEPNTLSYFLVCLLQFSRMRACFSTFSMLESFISMLRRVVELVGVDLSIPFRFSVHLVVVYVGYYPVLSALNANLSLTLK